MADWDQTNIITAPAELTDVAEFVCEDTNDLATLCKSTKINKWAKYKPCRYDKISPPEGIASSRDKWLLPASGSPWWYGLVPGAPANEIVHLEDKLEDVKQNVAWKYNRAQGVYRLGDFVGYDADADAPFAAGVLNMSEIYINTAGRTPNFGVTILERDSDRNDLSLAEIAAMNGKAGTFNLYVCAFVKVRRNKRIVATLGAVCKTALKDADDGMFFYLSFTPGADNTATLRLMCADNGISSTEELIRLDDYLEVYLCMTDNAVTQITDGSDVTPEDLNLFSVLPDEDTGKSYRLIRVAYNAAKYYIDYSYSGTPSISINGTLYSGKYYADDEGSIYKISGCITGLYANVVFDPNTQCPAYSSFVVRTLATATCSYAGGSATVKKCGNIAAYSEGAGNFSVRKTVNINGGSGTFTYYDTMADALNETNGKTGNGVPIFSEIVYNNADANIVGNIGSGDLVISPYARATTSWTSILFTNKNGTVITTLN